MALNELQALTCKYLFLLFSIFLLFYDPLGNRLSTTDIYGQKTVYQFELASQEISQTDPNGYTEFKEYNANGHVTKLTDKEGYVTCTRHNLNGDPFEISHPDGTTQKYTYNLRGHLVQEVNRDGTSTHYKVDYKGRFNEIKTFAQDGTLVKTLSYIYKGPNLLTEIDALGNSTHYQYDGAGRKIAKIQGPVKTHYGYDAMGRENQTIVADHVDIKKYDLLDRVIEERVEDSRGNIYSQTQYEYDFWGNRVSTKEYTKPELFNETRTLYNAQSQPILETDALGFQKKILYRQTDHLEKETIEPGRQTVEIYDPCQNLIEIKIQSSKATLARSRYEYDGKGNKVKHQEDRWLDGVYIDSYVVESVYDGMNQKIRETVQKTQWTEWTYDKGRLQTLTLPDKGVITYEYDALGRLYQQIASDGTLHYRFVYDLNDNLIQSQDLINQTAVIRQYDPLNRLVYEKQAKGTEFFFTYDDLNRMTKMSFYDIGIVYEYSPLNLISASRYVNDQCIYKYTHQRDWKGKILQAECPNQIVISYQWDKMGRCEGIDSISFRQSLKYDVLGNLIQTEVNDGLGSYQAQFSYDGLNQLIHEKSPFENTYQYDSLRNRLKFNEADIQVNHLNHLLQDSLHTYKHDLNGRRTAKADAHYTFDALGRLTSFCQKGEEIKYNYDALGRRIACVTPETTLLYLYQGDTEIGAIKDNKLTEFRLIHNHATLALELDGKLYSPIRNHRGDICQLLHGNQVAATYRYDAFGMHTQEGISSPWLFSGQRYGATTQLYHFEKREYDPSTGRWLTPDPLGFAEGPNLFAYVQNNPLMYVDPYGLWREEARDFLHGSSRGAIDDTTWSASGCVLGNYEPPSKSAKYGYYVGTGASMAASLLYGGGQGRLLKGSWSIAKKIPALLQKTKSLRNTKKIVQNSASTSKPPLAEVFKKTVAAETNVVNNVIKKEAKPSLDFLSKSGQAMDRGGLTKAGRALDKHGGREGSYFPKPTGNVTNKNIQGQYHLDDILTHPDSIFKPHVRPKHGNVMDIKIPGERGVILIEIVNNTEKL